MTIDPGGWPASRFAQWGDRGARRMGLPDSPPLRGHHYCGLHRPRNHYTRKKIDHEYESGVQGKLTTYGILRRDGRLVSYRFGLATGTLPKCRFAARRAGTATKQTKSSIYDGYCNKATTALNGILFLIPGAMGKLLSSWFRCLEVTWPPVRQTLDDPSNKLRRQQCRLL